jgi:hypothetical protein
MAQIDTTSRDELKLLTGLQRPSAIKRFLSRQRIPYLVGADGWPRVLNATIIEKMGGNHVVLPAHEPQLRLRNG